MSNKSNSSQRCGCKHKDAPTQKEKEQSLRENPGATIDASDPNRVNATMVKNEVCALNNNPRNND